MAGIPTTTEMARNSHRSIAIHLRKRVPSNPVFTVSTFHAKYVKWYRMTCLSREAFSSISSIWSTAGGTLTVCSSPRQHYSWERILSTLSSNRLMQVQSTRRTLDDAVTSVEPCTSVSHSFYLGDCGDKRAVFLALSYLDLRQSLAVLDARFMNQLERRRFRSRAHP